MLSMHGVIYPRHKVINIYCNKILKDRKTNNWVNITQLFTQLSKSNVLLRQDHMS